MLEGRLKGSVQFTSSDDRLTKGFHWAKEQALAYVREGDPVGDWYEAALPGRQAFCMRDVSHQATGAQALGLASHNKNMLRKFAINISEAKDWCSYWEINREDRPAPVDYTDDQDFWYNLPANFDLLHCCYRQFKWTGDPDYLEDPAFLEFYQRTVDDYVKRWDINNDGLLEHLPEYGRRGIASYNEDGLSPLVAGDLLAAQYGAYVAYAEILKLKGRLDEAGKYRERAKQIRELYNTSWWNEDRCRFYGAKLRDGSYYDEYYETANIMPLYFSLVEPGRKLEMSLLQLLIYGARNVEATSYLPEVLYRYGVDSAARAILLQLTSPDLPRREYPEVSYSVIGAFVTGLMGIKPNGVDHSLYTCPHLTADVKTAEIQDLPVLSGRVSVAHRGLVETTLTNRTERRIIWQAAFPRETAELRLDRTPVPAEWAPSTYLRQRISYISVVVEPGDTRVVQVT